jgi:hypothetical protein
LDSEEDQEQPSGRLKAQNKVTDKHLLRVFPEKKSIHTRYFFDPIDRVYSEEIPNNDRTTTEQRPNK